MTNYLIRRIFQMIVVIFLAALFVYFLFNISPGGPLAGLQQQQRRLTREDLARLRAQYELDLYWPVRFTRWLVGFPSGPITVGGRELFAEVPVGCYLPRERSRARSASPAATTTFISARCPSFTRRSRSSRGILRGDFGLSTVILKDRAGHRIAQEPAQGHPATDDHFAAAFAADRRAHRHLQRGQAVLPLRLLLHDHCLHRLRHADLLLRAAADPALLRLSGLSWRTPSPGSRACRRGCALPCALTRSRPGCPRFSPAPSLDQFLHLIMPVGRADLLNMAPWSRFVRSSMLEVLRQDYVRTARAKGLLRAGRDHEARPAQRPDPVRDDRGAVDPRRCLPARSSPRRCLPGPAWAGSTTTR